jgi:hypothetical protein
MMEVSTGHGEKTKRKDPIDDSREGKRRVDEAEVGRGERCTQPWSFFFFFFLSIHAREGNGQIAKSNKSHTKIATKIL